jgi:hypothetical protein
MGKKAGLQPAFLLGTVPVATYLARTENER